MEAATATAVHPEAPISTTELAYERTTMAWIRTAISLISFGFTIYKFFDLFKKEEATPHGIFGPRRLALSMIGLGLFSLLAAVLQRWHDNKRIPGAGSMRHSLATIVAALVGIIGVLTFITVVFRQ